MHAEADRSDEGAGQAGRSEADQVLVVAETSAAPAADQHLVDRQALQGHRDGVPDRDVPRISAEDEAGQDDQSQHRHQSPECS